MGQLGPLRAGLFLGVRGLWRGVRGQEEGHLPDPGRLGGGNGGYSMVCPQNKVLVILRMRRERVLFLRQLSWWSFGFLGVIEKEEGHLPDPGRLGGGNGGGGGGTPWFPTK